MSKLWPDFLVVGAAKCAMTWIVECLREHSSIYMPSHEIRYFSVNYSKSVEWYRQKFPEDLDNKIVGEKSPSYFVNDKCVGRIYEHNPNTNILVMLRDPVERAYSHYCMLLRAGVIDSDIISAANRHPRILKDGEYFSNIKPYINTFGEEKVHIETMGNVKNEPEEVLNRVFSFIGVKKEEIGKVKNEKSHRKRPIPRYQFIYDIGSEALSSMYGFSEITDQILNKFRKSNLVKKIHKINKGDSYPKLTDSEKNTLINYYIDEMYKVINTLEVREAKDWVERYK